MGWTDNARLAHIDGDEKLTLYPKRIEKSKGFKTEKQDLEGVIARVEDGAALEKRITATRLVFLPVIALVAKKKKGGESFVTIEGPEFVWAVEVDRKKKNDAVKFVAKVNNAVKKL